MLAEARQLRKRALERRQRDKRAATLMPLDPTLQLQLVQRLADRRPTHTETLAEGGEWSVEPKDTVTLTSALGMVTVQWFPTEELHPVHDWTFEPVPGVAVRWTVVAFAK